MAGVRTSFLSRFVGRERELGEVRSLVRSNRLVTLLGTGGLGKTRLGFHVLDDLAPEFPGGAWAVELADLVEPRLLVHAISAAMEVPPPVDELDTGLLAGQIGEGRALIYLDNCEHLLDSCAKVVTALLSRCPGLQVLTSSRQALGVLGEQVYQVPPLGQDDSVELFADRAAATQPTWALASRDQGDVLELCRTLEGVPLAIELAAVQIRAFTPQAMTGRLRKSGALLSGSLRGESGRRASLEACIQWSFDLCTPDEQRLWSRLSVFSGGFTLDAAEAVCSDENLGGDAIVVALRGLVDKSLLDRDTDDVEGRYRMLEVIRQFGSAKLAVHEVAEWRRRHRDYYLAMAERFDGEWTGPEQKTWIQRFRQEHANLRLAFDLSAADPAEAPLAMRMAPVLEHYFASTGGGPEAVHWLQLMLAHGTGTPRERASALRIGVFIGSLIAALDVAAEMYDELIQLAAETGDDVIRGHQLYAGAVLRTWQSDPVAGGQLAEQGIEVLHELGDVPREANLHFLHGMMLGWVDQPRAAATAYQRCFELTEPRRERWLTSYSLWGMGVDAFMAGRLEEAVKLEREALEAKADFGDQLGIGLTLGALGWVAAERGRGRDAALLLGATEAIWARIGMTVAAMPYLSRRREEGMERTRRLLGAEEFDALLKRGGEMPQDDVIQLALGRTQVDHSPSPLDALTRREREIADHLAVGESNKEIAESLFISVRTVETHVENILRKLNLQSRAQVPAALKVS